ncbi:MAG TPA: hypothetical protein EYH06_03965 [Chromatiales bacterium]|nr:hypothetical protein [Thiotrichales bacterium]HIP67729.1 hypothetical protein [Chromatiales bacterium]
MDYIGDDENEIVVLLGQSHGPSVVGNGRLARKRVDFIYRQYVSAGFPKSRLYRMSGWASDRPNYTCGRGVEVVILRRDQAGLTLPIGCKNSA